MADQEEKGLAMRKLTLTQFMTLDGVVQSPGGPDEDPSGGFTKGGWLPAFANDPEFGEVMDARFAKAGGFVLGRKTYEIFAAWWPDVDDDDPVAAKLNHLLKYVASTTLASANCNHTMILDGVVVESVTKLKAEDGDELQIHGSGQLAQMLMRHNLIDVYELLVFPVVLGEGKRLFETGIDHSMRLANSSTTDSGIVVLTYEPAGERAFGSVDDSPNP
jgi:dihydrofolate reductase